MKLLSPIPKADARKTLSRLEQGEPHTSVAAITITVTVARNPSIRNGVHKRVSEVQITRHMANRRRGGLPSQRNEINSGRPTHNNPHRPVVAAPLSPGTYATISRKARTAADVSGWDTAPAALVQRRTRQPRSCRGKSGLPIAWLMAQPRSR